MMMMILLEILLMPNLWSMEDDPFVYVRKAFKIVHSYNTFYDERTLQYLSNNQFYCIISAMRLMLLPAYNFSFPDQGYTECAHVEVPGSLRRSQ